MSASQTVRRSARWLVGTNLAIQVGQFLIGIILARLLVPADFGMMVTIQIFTGLVGLVASGGMGQALVWAKDVNERDFNVAFTVQMLIGVVIFVSFYVISPSFAEWFGDPVYAPLLKISAVTFLIRPLANQHVIWLQREMRFKETAIRNLICTVVSGALSIAMAARGFGVWSLTWGGIVGSLVGYFLVCRLTPMRARLDYSQSIVARFGSYGFRMVMNEVISHVRAQTANLIITKFASSAAVGVFNKADSLSKMPFSVLSAPVYQPVFRAMSKVQDEPDKIKYLFFRMVSLLLLYTLPLYIGMWWLAKPFIVVVYGEHWVDTAGVLEIIAPLGFLYCLGHPSGAVLAATNRLGREMVVHSLTWVFVAVGVYVGLDRGIEGAAWGVVASQIYSNLHMYWLATRCFDTRIKDVVGTFGPTLALNAILLLTLFAVHLALPPGYAERAPQIYLAASIIVGGIVYAAAFLFLPLRPLADEALRWRRLLRMA
ncbi:MAG TPA: lipopolysaccharide biosynthesis protein [Gammaproteobacteria bacterium]|nr:lipopolysaccharide biosynthesis protein [Gammaproteobacteria bacterium]